jgi:hypothetical protein
LLVLFLRSKIFPQNPFYNPSITTGTIGWIESWETIIVSWTTTTTLSSWEDLHFLYERIAEKNIKESFIKNAFDDCADLWQDANECATGEKNNYIFADYTLNFSIATWSLYYTRDPTSNVWSYADGHIKIYVKNLSGIATNVRSRIDTELTNKGTRPWYIQTYILSDYWPIGLGWWIESPQTYELPWLSFPKADVSRIFVFFGGQEYPLNPYIGILFTKGTYLVGMFSYDNNFLPQERQDTYRTYFQQPKFLENESDTSYFVDYITTNKDFALYANTFVEKIFKVLELVE